MTIIKRSIDKAQIHCNVCKDNITVGLNIDNNDYWDLPKDWDYYVIEDTPNAIHICPKHRIEFNQFVNEYIEWKKKNRSK